MVKISRSNIRTFSARRSWFSSTRSICCPKFLLNPELAYQNACKIHPGIEIIEVSCTSGVGFESWLGWLAARAQRKQASKAIA